MIDAGLNAAQKEAVEYRGGALMILAGAGSGKTRVLTTRLVHLVEHDGIQPQSILAVTFTNRAAGEMRERVKAMLGRDPAGLWIGTFHSISARLLRREANLIGFTPQFTIYDERDRLALIKRLLERHGYSHRTFPPKQIQYIISSAKNRLVSAEELGAESDERVTRVAAEIYHAMTKALQRANAMDFDDLLIHPLTVFREHPHRLEMYQRRFSAILVDEFQDTNRAQYLMVRQLAARTKEICVVGDDDQSIYSWRGANVGNMLDFQSDFPNAHLIRLEENYRSTQVILDAANGVIEENTGRLGKTLFTKRQGGDPVCVVAAADERDEAEWVARELRERAAADDFAFSDMSILYRTNAQSRALEEALRRYSVPYRIVGAAGFYERKEVKDLIAYLRLAINSSDDEAFMRVVNLPRRGIGTASIRTLQMTAADWSKPFLETAAIADRIVDLRPLAKERFIGFAQLVDELQRAALVMDPSSLLERIIESVGYESYLSQDGAEGIERMDNVRELVAGAAEWCEETPDEEVGSLAEQYLASAALASPTDTVGGDPDGVTLMTMHSAKGLEWSVVVITGMEDGLFPLSRSLESSDATEEERRLAYVGITRARYRVYLTWARTRRRGGQLLPGMPSRFLDSLPPGIVSERQTSGIFGGDTSRRSSKPSWMAFEEIDPATISQDAPRYVKGERVRHGRFGSGTIAAVSGRGRDLKAVVNFDDDEVGCKHLLVAYAGLERDWESA